MSIYEITIQFDGFLGRLPANLTCTREVEGKDEVAKVAAWCESEGLAYGVRPKRANLAMIVIAEFKTELAEYRREPRTMKLGDIETRKHGQKAAVVERTPKGEDGQPDVLSEAVTGRPGPNDRLNANDSPDDRP